ncbi:hypothetical protein B0A52_06528 [Exophiala mesophila]|uniref:Piwi domain-containing protein n=1 Tax=Exophiala mesophila TaxID=212818 RepID=A0A438N1C7_EXOME|nr:hypothetical protein B0A52_06528 [Exophiala mesophila]
MSGPSRRRGGGRPPIADELPPESPSRRGDRLHRPSAFDGPASRGPTSASGASHSRGVSNPPSMGTGRGSGRGSPAPSQVTSSTQPQAMAAMAQQHQTQQGGDPARDPPPRLTDSLRNVDLPASFYNIDQLYTLPTQFMQRPSYNTTGQVVKVNLNAYAVQQFPNIKIHQYDVVIGNGNEKRPVQRKVWNSKVRKQATGPPMLYDGHRLAWSSKDHNELRLLVDLDVEEGRPSRDGRNSFRLHIKKTRELDVSIIQSYLDGRIQMSVHVLEALNFMDHLLREGPSNNDQLLSVKRSFFKRDSQRLDLTGGVEAWRGVYQSMRLAEGKKMVLNLDVANACFYRPTDLMTAIIRKNGLRDPSHIEHLCTPRRTGGSVEPSNEHAVFQLQFKGVIVKASYPGNPLPEKEWKIHAISTNNALEEKLEWKDPKTRQPTGERVTVAVYFKRKYNAALKYPRLPLVEMTKKNVKYPMELLYLIPGNRYLPKLDEVQTANMIKFAVSPPSVRLQAIKEGQEWLNWAQDPYLAHYGLKLNHSPIASDARILPAPTIRFGGNKLERPGTRGRWDLKQKTFLLPNPKELSSWGIGVFPGRNKPDQAAIEKFAFEFARAYRAHGGDVAKHAPHIMLVNSDAAQAVQELTTATGNRFRQTPQLLIFLVQDKNAFHYLRIKKSCDCRFGIVSQVMQLAQVLKGNPQYYSNVLMKVNAKLGGTTSQAVPHPSSGFKSLPAYTMFIGADVSHASPGSPQASMAAITVSWDQFGGRYAAACQSNGRRVEMISDENWQSCFAPLVLKWKEMIGHGRLPEQVYYMRDGVSEGQYVHVMNREVPAIKRVLGNVGGGGGTWNGKLTVIIASKRHHIRCFPTAKGGDQKGNPLPGTLIERDVTMPNEFDFYLHSHIALQGTSRPVHYTILHDDAKHRPEVIQNMIYEHCYQYMRSTTSVSLHPAVYYAHLASNRARTHEDIPAGLGPQGGPGFKQGQKENDTSEPVKPLIPMFAKHDIHYAMWYI